MSDGERWLLGLRREEERPLTDDERRGLSRENGWRLWGIVALVVAAPPALFLALAALTTLVESTAWGGLFVLVLFVGLALIVLEARRQGRRWRTLRRDLRAGVAAVYRNVDGVPVAWSGHAVERLEALARSGRILKVNGNPTARLWVDALGREERTASVPQMASVAAQWVERVPEAPQDLGVNRRDLTDAERAEIRQVRVREAVRTALIGVAVAAGTGLGGAAALRGSGGSLLAFDRLMPTVAFVLGVGSLPAVWARGRHVALLGRDAREGVVVVVAPMDRPEEAVEVLPWSRAVWMTGSQPAPWRRLGR